MAVVTAGGSVNQKRTHQVNLLPPPVQHDRSENKVAEAAHRVCLRRRQSSGRSDSKRLRGNSRLPDRAKAPVAAKNSQSRNVGCKYDGGICDGVTRGLQMAMLCKGRRAGVLIKKIGFDKRQAWSFLAARELRAVMTSITARRSPARTGSWTLIAFAPCSVSNLSAGRK
jgi:hypothetical protein